MKKLLFLLAIALVPVITSAQKKNVKQETNDESVLYNEKGEFRADNSLTISENQYEVWKKAEPKILTSFHTDIAERMKKETKKNKFSKRYIISFDCDAKSISNIECAFSPDKHPDDEL